jgi:hypothetical protein
MSKTFLVFPALLKAHVKSYTRKDGAFVQEHDDKRQAAAPNPAAPEVRTRNSDFGFHGEAVTHHLRSKLGPDNYYSDAKESDLIEANSAAKKKFSAAANHLVQAGHFDSHDAARDYLDSKSGRHLHNAAPDGDISKVGWLAKDVKNHKAMGGVEAGMKATAKPAQAQKTAPAGYVAPKEGDVGHEEHKQYGAYFRKGDKVKDARGDQHEVVNHRGAEVLTNHGTFHPTKLSFAGAGGQK